MFHVGSFHTRLTHLLETLINSIIESFTCVLAWYHNLHQLTQKRVLYMMELSTQLLDVESWARLYYYNQLFDRRT